MVLRVPLLVLALLFSVSLAIAIEVSPTPTPEPSQVVSGGEKLDAKEIRNIRREFQRKLDLERETLKKDQVRNKKEHDAQRKAQKKTWDKTEADARRKFFEEHRHGPERREYMHDLNSRRIAFYDRLKAEEKNDKGEREARWNALEADQKNRWKAVEESLRRGMRPDSKWLQSGS